MTRAIAFIPTTQGPQPSSHHDRINKYGFRIKYGLIKNYCIKHEIADIQFYFDHSTNSCVNFFTRTPFIEALRDSISNKDPLVVPSICDMLARLDADTKLSTVKRLVLSGTEIIDAEQSRALHRYTRRELWMLERAAVRRRLRRPAPTSYDRFHDQSHLNLLKLSRAGTRGIEKAADDFARLMAPTLLKVRDAVGDGQQDNLSAIARELNARGYLTRRGRPWSAQQVKRLIARVQEASSAS